MFTTRIVFFGTRIWQLTSRHLAVFLKYQAKIAAFIECPVENISTTVAQDDPYETINEAAARLGTPIYCPENVKDPEFLERLADLKPDLIIVCGYQAYLPKRLLDIPPLGVINFHSSLLPRHCGMHPGFQTIWYGDKESGMTVHYMDTGLDTGDIIYRTTVPVVSGDTVDTLYDRIWESSEALVPCLLKDLDDGTVPREPQDMSQYFYNYEIGEQDYELDFRQPAEVLFGRVKMMPGKFYFVFQGQKYFVNDCSIQDEPGVTRRFTLRAPYFLNDKLVFATPRKFLQIESILSKGEEVEPLALTAKGRIQSINVKG